MAWRKSPSELVEAFQRALPDDPRAERRTMFGYPCSFVNGNMYTGLHQESMVVRLPPEAREELLKVPGAAPFIPMPGRPMKEYVAVPPAMLQKPKDLKAWVARAFEYAASLPAKEPKKKAAKKTVPRRG